MAPVDLAAAVKSRTLLIKKLVKTQALIVAIDPATVTSSALSAKRDILDDLLVKADKLCEYTQDFCTIAVYEKDHEADFDTLFGSLESMKTTVMELQKSTDTTHKSAFKLERVKLPTFSGKFTDWQSFRDLFQSSVDQDRSISGAEKMVYLKSYVSGDAAAVISSFQATAANYTEAWTCLKARYDNNREIIFAHIRKFDDFKPIQGESGSSLRSLVDSINECVRSLKVLTVPVEHWDLIIIFLSMKKLDPETRKFWSLEQKATLPTLKEFLDFVEKRARALNDSSLSYASKSVVGSSSSDPKKKASSSHVAQSSQKPLSCIKCAEPHHLHNCKAFASLSMSERNQLVTQKHLCLNCLFKGHPANQCKMSFSCRKCGKKHHTLLHRDSQFPSSSQSTNSTPVPVISEEPTPSDPLVVSSSFCTGNSKEGIVLLGTLLATAKDSNGQHQVCRVFVDPGSEVHFISEKCVKFLGLKRKKTCIDTTGIGGVRGEQVHGFVSLRIFSRINNFSLEIGALILPKITNLMPRSSCKSSWSHLENLELADPQYHSPSHVDILLGAKATKSIMIPEFIHGPVGSPFAQQTKFGWMLSGEVQKASSQTSRQVQSYHSSCNVDSECLESSLQRFWSLEEPETQEHPWTSEEEECESHFIKTHRRGKDGRYILDLPFRQEKPHLGHSRELAVKRFQKVENRLSQDPDMLAEYIKCMREYISFGFMELVPEEELNLHHSKSYYLPHSMVVKETSTTFKYRIVFDASSKTSSGVSLNDLLMTGPKLQVDLVPLLIRFRSHLIAMSADIIRFYPQFQINSEHVDYHRLVWREAPNHQLKDYRMVRVTFGVTSAPFMAIRSLHHLAETEKDSFPLAHTIIKEDLLVDNVLSGSNDLTSAKLIRDQVIHVLEKGRLQLRKWTSNNRELLADIPEDLQDPKTLLSIGEDSSINTIGLQWNPKSDIFRLSISVPDLTSGSSKRKVLSSIAKIFDPLGWASPVTVRPKILMQEFWKSRLDWDSPLSHHHHKEWFSYCQELQLLQEFSINRCLIKSSLLDSSNSIKYELHGFSDSSKLAYSACIYLRTINAEGIISQPQLVVAKTKVAPVKSETIPRLELCGAVLLTKVMKMVMKSLALQFHFTRCWTDSTTVLDWLSSDKKLPIFVINRVRKIESDFPRSLWFYVPGKENPADLGTRGISASQLIDNSFWLHGPAWLSTAEFPAEVISLSTQVQDSSSVSKIIHHCSSFSKMKRLLAYWFRFINNCQLSSQKEARISGKLTVNELNYSLNQIISCVQSETLHEEIERCKRSEVVKSNVKFLSPFLDEDGILRVGGRLNLASCPYQKKHPILLPKNHHFTETLVRYHHLTLLHGGPQLVLANIRDQFWILRGPDVVKRIIRQCVICHRQNSSKTSQLMGQLPLSRVLPSRPFSQCGVDFAGPFYLCLRPGRNPKIIKSYVSLFICMATRAIHLELVGDLSTPSFTGALIRFISRRGLPSDIYCDGGKNFEGSKNELKEVTGFLNSTQHSISSLMSEKGIKFHFNPPLSPHHGGLWEAGVKSMKHHLNRVIQDRKLSIEEFSTLLAQVEAALNSRPLTPLSTDPNDFGFLTPAHFLVGDNLTSIPQLDVTNIQHHRLSRWQAVQQMFQHFWKRWQSEYLSRLQSRPKWFAPQPDLQPGVLVLIRDSEPAWGPLKWKLGRISAVYRGPDNKVRVCDVKTSNGSVYKRPIVKLSPLPIYQ